MTGTARDRALQLFEAHGAALYRFAAVLVHRHEDAEDVVQESFLKLLHHLERGGDDANLRGWLFTVAAHAARDRMRRRARWLPWSEANEVAVAPAALADEDGRLTALRRSLQRLASRDRLLLALRAQGLSYREMAEVSGIRPASIGRLLARAVQRWERAYGDCTPLPQAYGR